MAQYEWWLFSGSWMPKFTNDVWLAFFLSLHLFPTNMAFPLPPHQSEKNVTPDAAQIKISCPEAAVENNFGEEGNPRLQTCSLYMFRNKPPQMVPIAGSKYCFPGFRLHSGPNLRPCVGPNNQDSQFTKQSVCVFFDSSYINHLYSWTL